MYGLHHALTSRSHVVWHGVACPQPGTYAPGSAATSCPNCDPGSYTNVQEASGCTGCNPGFFQVRPLRGGGVFANHCCNGCMHCDVYGCYNPQASVGQTYCPSCPDGYWQVRVTFCACVTVRAT